LALTSLTSGGRSDGVVRACELKPRSLVLVRSIFSRILGKKSDKNAQLTEFENYCITEISLNLAQSNHAHFADVASFIKLKLKVN
jgi:hypothetical protein